MSKHNKQQTNSTTATGNDVVVESNSNQEVVMKKDINVEELLKELAELREKLAKKQAKKDGKKVPISKQHRHLKFKVTADWEIIKKSGVKIDSGQQHLFTTALRQLMEERKETEIPADLVCTRMDELCTSIYGTKFCVNFEGEEHKAQPGTGKYVQTQSYVVYYYTKNGDANPPIPGIKRVQ